MSFAKTRTWMLLALALAALASGCGTSEGDDSEASSGGGESASGDEILLGAAIPLSGPSGEEGERIREGFELAIERINANGGVGGKQLRLDVQDDQGQPETGVALVDRFEQAGASAIIGTYNSPVALAMAGPVRSAKIPHVMVAVSGAIAELENPFQYQTMATDVEQIEGVVDFLERRGIERPALLTDTTPLGAEAKEPLTNALREAGLDPVASESFEVDATDLSPQLLKLKNANADGIVMWTVGAAYARAVQGLDQIGYDVPIFGNAATSDPAVARIAGDDADELYYQDVLHPDKPEVQPVREAWEEANPDQELPFISVLAWDIVQMLGEGLEESGGDPVELKGFLDGYSSTERASGAPGSTWEFTKGDHQALTSEDLVWKVYRDGEVEVAEQAAGAAE